MQQTFPIAPMSTDIRILTLMLLPVPLVLVVAGEVTGAALQGVAGVMVLIFALVWFGYRPGAFVITDAAFETIFPVRTLRIERDTILTARVISRAEIKTMLGFGMRIGAGGLWGGFGLLWTQKRGLVQMYISRTDELVWIERGGERAWLISPADPHQFVAALLDSQVQQ